VSPLRIIAGELRGRKLVSPHGRSIRPTADRLRESIFNTIGPRVAGQVLLDLFAGTGAFGIEALSRRAQFAVFIDNHPEALALVQRNLINCRLQGRARVIKWNIFSNLNCLKGLGLTFELIFIDPPYDCGLIRPTLAHLEATGALGKDCRLIVEHAPKEPIPEDISSYALADQRKYGKSLVSYLNYVL
jgi:16S rRNA (guanine966-N2)-methyltransferase